MSDKTETERARVLREQLAALAHEQWSGWMRYLWSRCQFDRAGHGTIPHEWRKRWERQMVTPYADLTEAEKESDRQEADRVLALVSSPCPPAWQAIETAPKDGTEILVYCENRAGLPGIVVAHYADWVEDHPPIDPAFYYWNGGQFTPATKPRLWMPRPPLPPVPPHGEPRT